LEYCDAGSVFDVLQEKNTFTESFSRKVIRQLAAAVGYLSGLNPRIIHYDIKTSEFGNWKGFTKRNMHELWNIKTSAQKY